MSDESDPEPILTLDEMTIDVCDIYNCLCQPTLSSKVVIHQRFAAAYSVIGKLRPIFHSTAPDALKVKLFKWTTGAIAAYALESFPLNLTTSNLLDAGHGQTIRAALGINWQSNTTNEEVFAKFGHLPFSQTIRKMTFRLTITRGVFRVDLSPLSGQYCNTLTSYSRYGVDFSEGFAQRSDHNLQQDGRCHKFHF